MFIPSAFAQTAGASGAQGGLFDTLSFFAPMILIFVAAYFLLMRPQQQRVKALQNAISAVKKGDQVVTAGGVMGKVTKVEDTVVELEIAANVRIRVVKATIAEVVNPISKPAND